LIAKDMLRVFMGSSRTIFKIWRRQSPGNENKIPVIIRITDWKR